MMRTPNPLLSVDFDAFDGDFGERPRTTLEVLADTACLLILDALNIRYDRYGGYYGVPTWHPTGSRFLRVVLRGEEPDYDTVPGHDDIEAGQYDGEAMTLREMGYWRASLNLASIATFLRSRVDRLDDVARVGSTAIAEFVRECRNADAAMEQAHTEAREAGYDSIEDWPFAWNCPGGVTPSTFYAQHPDLLAVRELAGQLEGDSDIAWEQWFDDVAPELVAVGRA